MDWVEGMYGYIKKLQLGLLRAVEVIFVTKVNSVVKY
jgi:hypothetical protein